MITAELAVKKETTPEAVNRLERKRGIFLFFRGRRKRACMFCLGNDERENCLIHYSKFKTVTKRKGGGNEADLSYLRFSYGLNREKSLRIPA